MATSLNKKKLPICKRMGFCFVSCLSHDFWRKLSCVTNLLVQVSRQLLLHFRPQKRDWYTSLVKTCVVYFYKKKILFQLWLTEIKKKNKNKQLTLRKTFQTYFSNIVIDFFNDNDDDNKNHIAHNTKRYKTSFVQKCTTK